MKREYYDIVNKDGLYTKSALREEVNAGESVVERKYADVKKRQEDSNDNFEGADELAIITRWKQLSNGMPK